MNVLAITRAGAQWKVARRLVAVVALAVAAITGGVVASVAASTTIHEPNSQGVYHGCYDVETGQLQLIVSGQHPTCASLGTQWRTARWNEQGQPGPAGPSALIIGGGGTNPANSTSAILPLFGGGPYDSNGYGYTVAPMNGMIDTFYFEMNGNGYAQPDVTATLYVNGIATPVSCTVTNNNTDGGGSCSDTSESDSVTAGQSVFVETSEPTTSVYDGSWSAQFHPAPS
jgi:hypothetical protein